jgi:hypothetical protein
LQIVSLGKTDMSLKLRLISVLGLLSMLLVAIGVLGLYGMRKSNEGLRTVYETRTVSLDRITNIDRNIVRSRLALAAVWWRRPAARWSRWWPACRRWPTSLPTSARPAMSRVPASAM